MRESEIPSAPAALDRSWAALATYDTGSPRAGLVPIDEAVAVSLPKESARETLEKELLLWLGKPLSTLAKIYICDKLRLIGSAAAVPALGALLPEPPLTEAVRGTLEILPCGEAGGALRQALPTLSGSARIGVVHALGSRRDPANVPVLIPLLNDSDAMVVAAAAAALGNIGTEPAAHALKTLADNPPQDLRPEIGHACLDAAAHLAAAGIKAEADALHEMLEGPGWPEEIREAARQGRASASAESVSR